MKFNEQQNQVINFKDGNSVVLAGAGSGKSTCLVERIKRLIDSGVDEEDIMTITFTSNSASDLKKKLNNKHIQGVRVGTFHSVCMRILSENGIKLKSIPKEYECINAIKDTRYFDNVDWKDIGSYISYQKSHTIGCKDEFVYKESSYTEEDLRIAYKAYEDFKDSKGYYDFDDLLLWTVDLLTSENIEICKYLLVDEAQDNNPVQNKLLKLFCKTNNIMLIGDFRQSIYSFRGSKPEEFMDCHKLLGDCKVINLDTNYRSKLNIVNKANDFIEKYYGDYQYYSSSISNNKDKGNIKIYDSLSRETEAYDVANKIEELVKNKVKNNDIAVLYRNNSISSHLEYELKTRGINYNVADNGSFFKRKEIEMILFTLRLIDNPNDNIAYEQLVKYQAIPFISKKILDSIKNCSAKFNVSYLEASELIKTNKPYERRNLSNFSEIVNKLTRQERAGYNLSTIIDNTISLLRLKKYIEEKYVGDEIDERLESIENFKKFIRNNSLKSLLKFVYEKNKRSKNDGDGVQLMTLHKSKGLEYDHVFIIGIEDEKFPNKKSPLKDEARLMYVGITRAKNNLYLSGDKQGLFISEYINKDIQL